MLAAQARLTEVQCARVVVIARDLDVPRLARAPEAPVHERARVIIIAKVVYVCVHTQARGVAMIERAIITVVAVDLNSTRGTLTRLAEVANRARVTVIARSEGWLCYTAPLLWIAIVVGAWVTVIAIRHTRPRHTLAEDALISI